jgi:hypothetical protein
MTNTMTQPGDGLPESAPTQGIGAEPLNEYASGLLKAVFVDRTAHMHIDDVYANVSALLAERDALAAQLAAVQSYLHQQIASNQALLELKIKERESQGEGPNAVVHRLQGVIVGLLSAAHALQREAQP